MKFVSPTGDSYAYALLFTPLNLETSVNIINFAKDKHKVLSYCMGIKLLHGNCAIECI